jgi:hypothetical protein
LEITEIESFQSLEESRKENSSRWKEPSGSFPATGRRDRFALGKNPGGQNV